MEKAPVTKVYRSTSDASGVFHDGTGLYGLPSKGTADCGNIGALIANRTFLAPQTCIAVAGYCPARSACAKE
jgi:hypothetical protein